MRRQPPGTASIVADTRAYQWHDDTWMRERERPRHRLRVRDVAEQAGILDVTVGKRRDDGALLAEAAHGRLADPARPAGDDHAFVLETLHEARMYS